jgi:PAS domain S-box-containing protein
MRDDQQELRDTAARLKAVLDGALDGIIAIDEAGIVQSINPAAIRLFGYPSDQVVGQNVKMLMPEPYRGSHDEYIKRYRETGEAKIIGIGREVVGQRKDGSTFPMDLGISEVRVANNRIFIGVARDITERKQADQRAKLLLAEVNHRAKNLLAVVQAVARQTAKKSEPSLFAKAFGERIAGLAASHDLLVRSEWAGVDVGDLAASQLTHFADVIGKRVRLNGPKVQVTPAAAQAIGMALHELATNASKHGALSNAQGSIDVDWREAEVSGQETFQMSWSERGGPKVTPPERNGFGRTVIVDMIKHTLGAQVSLCFADAGLTWTMVAPVDRVCRRQSSQTDPQPPENRALACAS